MASIFKNQIFKLLSKFTKGLSTDKINLSTFKGEGELSNLELDEIVLTDLLDLPSWLRITNAWCDNVHFRVQWTQLKSVPILLSLNKVSIAVETCEELRSTSCVQGLSSYAGAAKYGFIYKVIDGVTITVNTVTITFKSPAFVANVELSRIIVQSKSRDWQDCKLPASRLKDNARGQVLLFKEVEWNDARIEAKSTKDPNLTPLRLITNKARCRITLKKKLLDSSIMGCRLAIILDDLLWVLTDFQLKAALHFIDSLVGLIQKATEITRKKKAARKLETLPEYQAQQSQSIRAKDVSSPLSKLFDKYDVVETSYHFQAQKIDLHFSDDPSAGRSCHPELKKGGALQVSLKKFRIDYYPYHLAIAERYHWATYRPAATPHTEWLKQAQTQFTNSLLNLVEEFKSPPQTPSNGYLHEAITDEKSKAMQNTPLKTEILKQMNKLMTSCLVLRISDFNIYQVTTSCGRKHIPKEFISGDKDRYFLPESEAALHAEFTYYYYPGDDPFPIPAPKFYVQLNPVQIHFDVISILWSNAFALNLYQSLLQTKTSQETSVSDIMYIDVKLEAILPRIIMESPIDYPGQKDRPKSLHLQVSRASITNVRSIDQSSRTDLQKCVDMFRMCSLFYNNDFPSSNNDFSLISQKFVDHFSASDNVRPPPYKITCTDVSELKNQLHREMLWTEAKDVWCINFEPIFGDFFGARAVGKDLPVPFLEAFPLTLWVYKESPDAGNSIPSNGNCANIHILTHVSTLVSLQVNHYQYLFLLRLFEEAKEVATYLSIDTARIAKSAGTSMVVGGVIPELDITFVMPSHSPGKESSGGDIESVIPDTSSLQDDGMQHWHSGSGIYVANSILDKCQTSASDCSINMHKILSEPPPLKKVVNGNIKPMYPAIGPKSLSLESTPQIPPENTFSFISSSIKKGFDKMMTSIDGGTKTSPDEISDNISVRSDISSDSESFIAVNYESSGGPLERFKDGMESLFHVNLSGNQTQQLQSIEVATEVVEEENTLTSPSEKDSSTSYYRRRDLVSTSTFKFHKVEFQQQSEELSSGVKVQISNLSVEDCSSIPWDEFQTKFSSRSRDWLEVSLAAGLYPKIKVKMDHLLKMDPRILEETSLVDRNHVLKWFEDTTTVKLESISLNLNASTLSGLVDLLEEELTPTPFPVSVFMENIKVRIVDDRPPCNITSPEPLPIEVVISRLIMNRLASGVIQIEPLKVCDTDKSKCEESTKDTSPNGSRLQSENDELRRRLSLLEGLTEENYRLKKYVQDNEKLRSHLQDAQREIDLLLQDKKNLLDRIASIESQWNSKR
ncbi:hypothetical protein RUM44_008201 [Polyplax serrata]|uniref:UHRF1-binding protein 1-like n=1 Tax=Polyplax serrata TaxID=468196 RepID=A0ABR1B9F2_POLSC